MTIPPNPARTRRAEPFNHPFGHRGACLDPARAYRYQLWRDWDDRKPRAVFVMLNPSTADEREDDPTVRRCVGFARAWGCGGLTVVNLFALRATDPAGLLSAADPVGPENDRHIRAAVAATVFDLPPVSHVVAAWGAQTGKLGAIVARRAERVRALLAAEGVADRLVCLGVTQGDHPRHPLYVPASAAPAPFPPASAGGPAA